jgi:hypothetical protein
MGKTKYDKWVDEWDEPIPSNMRISFLDKRSGQRYYRNYKEVIASVFWDGKIILNCCLDGKYFTKRRLKKILKHDRFRDCTTPAQRDVLKNKYEQWKTKKGVIERETFMMLQTLVCCILKHRYEHDKTANDAPDQMEQLRLLQVAVRIMRTIKDQKMLCSYGFPRLQEPHTQLEYPSTVGSYLEQLEQDVQTTLYTSDLQPMIVDLVTFVYDYRQTYYPDIVSPYTLSSRDHIVRRQALCSTGNTDCTF